MSKTYFKSGDWNAECERCGFVYKASQLRKEWTGFMVCKSCWEPRHPSDFFKMPAEDVSVPFTAPESDDTTPVQEVTGNQTLTVAYPVYHYKANLSSNVTVTLSSSGAQHGDRIQIWRTGAGAYTVNIGGLRTSVQSLPFYAEVEYTTAWRLVHLTYTGL